MKNIKILIASFLMLGIVSLITSCEPESHSLGKTLDKSDIQFDITQDFTADPGGNTVILTNQTKGVTLNWDYVTGKSNKALETVKYAFKGDYTIKITAVTSGGLVELDPVTITVTDDNLNYVNDPLWTALSGGVGHSKTWVLDLDENGDSKYFAGPMYFYGTSNGWLAEGGEWSGGDTGCYGDDCWNWNPEWKGNQWIAAQGNYGSMTFSLDGGPFLTTNHLMIPSYGEESGTYFLDINTKTLTTSNATILHTNEYETCVDNWYEMKVFSITENSLQLGVLRKSSCDGAATLVYNFISKEYSDNWVPEDLPDPNPSIDLDGGSVDDLLAVTTTTSKTWHLSADSPFNWTDLNGSFLNNFNTVEDYEAVGWTGYVAADQDDVIKNKITFSDDGSVNTIDSNGVEASGTYSTSTDGTNIISFTGITPTFPIGSSWATVSTTSQNQWKIVKTAKTGTLVTDIWFGKRDEVKSEYMVFHFVLDDPSSDPDAGVKAILTKNPWKLDSNRTYDVTTGYGALQGPVVFSDYATWAWNPLPGEHYAAGDAGVDYGTMTFNTNGTMVVNQLTDIGTVTLNGNWSVTDGELSITAEMLHPWTADFAVADWTAIQTFKIENGALLLQAERDPVLSGEDAFWITWIFVPGT
ncbi:hypothetical protein CJ739_1004 [Mariniflexile rhizosphaerae]|uniref:hypothetical protein n=1 Tax=unclassified Mariniflexile TaxID=2643887 RepID=UPI000E33559F|nr:hypothetical protein [Mariniflexile sp. TRM1-10]AXP80097.1 hypothetical protein CJ739_1004 [Mariniflexile sp. TRM1-10]